MRAFALAMAVVAALAGCTSRLGTADGPVPPVDGRSAYARACASCHGTSGMGDGPAAASLSQPVPDLTTLAARYGGRFPRDYVAGVVRGEPALAAHGTREMPVWGRRFEAKGGTVAGAVHVERWLDAVTSHVESLQQANASAGAP